MLTMSKNLKENLAKSISAVGNPLLLAPIIIGWSEYKKAGADSVLDVFVPLLGIIALPTALWVFIKKSKGQYSNYDVSNRKQRVTLYVFMAPLMLAATIYVNYMQFPPDITVGFTVATCLLIVAFVINFFIKSSMHAAIGFYLSIALFALTGIGAGFMLLFSGLISWSRWYLKRHTISEIVMGCFLGLLSGLIYLSFI